MSNRLLFKAVPAARAASVLLAVLTAGAVALPAARAGQQAPQLSAVAQLGKALFYDTTLSGSGRMSCASCHDPANHYAPANGRAVQLGGPDLSRPGLRAVPTLTYKTFTPAFSIGPEDPSQELNEVSPMAIAAGKTSAAAVPLATRAPATAKGANAAANIVPRGGMFWDGRAVSLQGQAMGPLLSPFEMANPDIATLYAKLRAAHGKQIAALFGASVPDDPQMTVSEAAFAIARYQVEDPSFHPFSSKYDAYLRGAAQLSPAEARGLKLFEAPDKGNCAACHLDKPGPDGRPPLFTDFEYEALGVPRNPAIPANADPSYHDLGLCGPLRHDAYARQPRNCGLFKTPTLRNVASRKAFFHNGVFHALKDVLRFYVLRDTDPGAVYPRGADGRLRLYDDLPARYSGNIDHADAPFDRHPGDPPALSVEERSDIVAYLRTLTDGYVPGH
ncbi:cytochrome-c peroxidase [Acidimangrovimonas pyrenivorans]|uniref:Cytochrome-c peroxidase n=1 Tax=Acidimangrovimonas pyrenivorans TaxID=2030798 RepID=A0ABV7AK04_9RHOB